MKSLDEILGDEEPVAAPVEQAIEAKQPEVEQPQAPPAQPRDESGKFAPKEPAEKPDQLPQEEYKALKAEREKRQTLEGQLAELSQQMEQLKNPPQPPAPPPSVWEDEQGAFQHFGQQVVSQATLNARLDMSEMMMRQANPDFEEMKQVFVSLMKDNPVLQKQALSDPHPWNKAYQIAKNHQTMQELGATDVASLEAKLREKIHAELAASVPVTKPTLPPTLTGERNVGQRTGPAWGGPTSLEDIL